VKEKPYNGDVFIKVGEISRDAPCWRCSG